jgi:hypothetical protein
MTSAIGNSDHDCEHNQADDPISNVEDRKILSDALSEGPPATMSATGLVDVAPLQFSEEVARVHPSCSLWSNVLGSREQLLEFRIIADRVRDRS